MKFPTTYPFLKQNKFSDKGRIVENLKLWYF